MNSISLSMDCSSKVEPVTHDPWGPAPDSTLGFIPCPFHFPLSLLGPKLRRSLSPLFLTGPPPPWFPHVIAYLGSPFFLSLAKSSSLVWGNSVYYSRPSVIFSVKPRWPLQAEDGMTSVFPQSVTQPFTAARRERAAPSARWMASTIPHSALNSIQAPWGQQTSLLPLRPPLPGVHEFGGKGHVSLFTKKAENILNTVGDPLFTWRQECEVPWTWQDFLCMFIK